MSASIALARSRAYALFSDLVARGVHPDNRAEVQAWPELASFFGDLDGAELEALAVRHERVFGLNLHLYESVFLDPQARPGGATTRRVADAYLRLGFEPSARMLSPDHLAAELAALSFLCGAEADAARERLEPEVQRIRRLEAAFLGDHLALWLPAASQALMTAGDPLFARVSELIRELVCDHAEDASVESVESPPEEVEREPDLTELLDRPETGLDQVVDHLLIPSRSGLFWSADRLGTIGRRHRVPTGFGSKRQRLRTLLVSASEREVFVEVVKTLKLECEEAASGLDPWLRATEGVARRAERWLRRLEGTVTGLEQMGQAVVDRGQSPRIDDSTPTDGSRSGPSNR